MTESSSLRDRTLDALRGVFLVAVLVFAWLGLRGRWGEVGDALSETSPGGALAGLLLVLAGLSATGLVWRRLMASLGAPLPVVDANATFFVGQLGKYIPGSVWSIGAQARLAARHRVPARTTVAAGLLFLGYHVATAVVLGALALLLGTLEPPWPGWVSWLGLVGAGVGLLPVVVRTAARRVAGLEPRIGAGETGVVLVLMAAAWTAYAGSLVLLAPDLPWGDLWALGAAFATAYAVGVVVVLAPAGVGAREGVFVLLLTPVTGVAGATALALLARVVHTVADGLLAAVWSFAARADTDRASSG
ncbi:MAG: lysylphosphatidylglycerol synthase domain-containing protein [Nocardioides sp.]|nr:lysylphosphatidylglycerol synthase domain-containing protein [Nocardioides sp.]